MTFLKTLLKLAAMLQKNTKSSAPKKAASVKRPVKPKIVRTSDYPTAIVGESYCQKAIAALCEAHTDLDVSEEIIVSLVCEDDNPHDADAVAVKVAGKKLGYLSSEDAGCYRDALEEECDGTPTLKVAAIIRGGGPTPDGTQKLFGVWLAIDMPPEFL